LLGTSLKVHFHPENSASTIYNYLLLHENFQLVADLTSAQQYEAKF